MFIHGLSKHPIYQLWRQIRRRCNKPNDISFKWYGARGIRMCSEWESNFPIFYQWCIKNGWKRGLSIDRKNSTQGYFPENCAFITQSINSKKRHQESPVNHRGNRNPSAKLNNNSVVNLRKDLINNISIKELIDFYKISRTQIYRIKNNQQWKDNFPLI